MADFGDGLKNIFLAGIGAIAYTGEKGKEIIDQLVAKGEITLDQGIELTKDLQAKAGEGAQALRESALEARMKAMTPEERDAFAAKAAELAAAQNAIDAAKAAAEAAEAAGDEEADEAAEELQAETEETVEDATEQVVEAVEEAVDGAQVQEAE